MLLVERSTSISRRIRVNTDLRYIVFSFFVIKKFIIFDYIFKKKNQIKNDDNSRPPYGHSDIY